MDHCLGDYMSITSHHPQYRGYPLHGKPDGICRVTCDLQSSKPVQSTVCMRSTLHDKVIVLILLQSKFQSDCPLCF